MFRMRETSFSSHLDHLVLLLSIGLICLVKGLDGRGPVAALELLRIISLAEEGSLSHV